MNLQQEKLPFPSVRGIKWSDFSWGNVKLSIWGINTISCHLCFFKSRLSWSIKMSSIPIQVPSLLITHDVIKTWFQSERKSSQQAETKKCLNQLSRSSILEFEDKNKSCSLAGVASYKATFQWLLSTAIESDWNYNSHLGVVWQHSVECELMLWNNHKIWILGFMKQCTMDGDVVICLVGTDVLFWKKNSAVWTSQ